MIGPPPASRLLLDGAALVANWRALDALSGSAAAGAAVKADAYGLGAREVVARLWAAECRSFFVAHWREAVAIADLIPPDRISVLHGILPGEEEVARELGARPVINSPDQARRWQEIGGGRPCDLMLDSGINRLGVRPDEWRAGAAEGLRIATLMSHLACADEDSERNEAQRARFVELAHGARAERLSLANSAGIALGPRYHFDLSRPGLALYGGVPRAELAAQIRPVAVPQARVVRTARLSRGDQVGYNGTFTASRDMPTATIALGYADGYLRAWSGRGQASVGGAALPVLGRVSMDLITLDATAAPDLSEGDWVSLAYDLPEAARVSGLSQYELLTGLGQRLDRLWR